MSAEPWSESKSSSESIPLLPEHAKTEFAETGWDVNFTKGDRIGGGGFAEVFKATHRKSGEVCALKISKTGDEYVRRLQREVTTLRKANSDYVVAIGEAGSDWYTMPLAEGNLTSIAPELSGEEKVRVIADAARGLGALHDIKVIHRDVSPNNILCFWTKDGRRHWVVSDLGLVKKPPGQSSIPKTQGVLGTPGFMAPEMFSIGAHDVDLRADIYSLGRTLAFIATAKTPQGQEPMAAPEPWTELVEKMTAFSREDPPQSMKEVLDVLPKLYEGVLVVRRQQWEYMREMTSEDSNETTLSENEVKVLGWLLQAGLDESFNVRTLFQFANPSVTLTIRVGLIALRRRKFLVAFTDNEGTWLDRLTEEGEAWVIAHQDLFDPKPFPKMEQPPQQPEDPDAPF